MSILLFIFGAVIGSFLNVCIYRLPQGKSIVSPPSACGSCGHRLSAIDLVPIFSWVLLRGKCRHCGERVSARYAVVELLTGALFVFAYLQIGLTWTLAKALFLISMLVVMIFIDLDHKIILDGQNALLALAGFLFIWLPGGPTWQSAGFGLLVGGGLLFIIAIFGPMGGGDIKFMAAAGLWLGLGKTILALYVGFIAGGLISLLLLVTKVRSRKDMIPFGPFLALGVFIAYFYYEQLLTWYVTIL